MRKLQISHFWTALAGALRRCVAFAWPVTGHSTVCRQWQPYSDTVSHYESAQAPHELAERSTRCRFLEAREAYLSTLDLYSFGLPFSLVVFGMNKYMANIKCFAKAGRLVLAVKHKDRRAFQAKNARYTAPNGVL